MYLYSNSLCKLYFNTVQWNSKYKFIHIIHRNKWNKYVSRTRFIKNTLSFLCFRNIYNCWAERSPFWSIPSSELTVVNVFLPLNYFPCFYLKTNKQTKITSCFSLWPLLFIWQLVKYTSCQIILFSFCLGWHSMPCLSFLSLVQIVLDHYLSLLCAELGAHQWHSPLLFSLTKMTDPVYLKFLLDLSVSLSFCWALLHLFYYEL